MAKKNKKKNCKMIDNKMTTMSWFRERHLARTWEQSKVRTGM